MPVTDPDAKTRPSAPTLSIPASPEDALGRSAGLDPAIVVGLVVLALLAAVLVLLYQVHARLQRQRTELGALRHLEPIEGAVRRLSDERGGLDLRRLEHVLIDIRDGQRRLEERLMAVVENLQGRELVLPPPAPGEGAFGGRLAERVTGRLLAMGFERIEIRFYY